MAEVEPDFKDLRTTNNELVQKVQYWKMTAAQKQNENLELMKENNELRLKLSRLRIRSKEHAQKLDAAIQSASEEALSHLVQASSAVARTLELAKTYISDQQELDSAVPRWSSLSATPSTDKINRVPPMLIGGRLMQPVVSLSRSLQANNSRSANRSPNQQTRTLPERSFAMHMLQDVYIPLTRIDAREMAVTNAEADMEVNNADNSAQDLGLEDSDDRIMEESRGFSEGDNLEDSRRLGVVAEDVEPESETPLRSRTENPLEGPSWLLDEPSPKRKSNLEPDSTTPLVDNEVDTSTPGPSHGHRRKSAEGRALRCEFTPTMRRRRPSPTRKMSNTGRILKVLVAKMRLDDDTNGDVSPPKRPNLASSPILTKFTKKTDIQDIATKPRDESPKFQVRDVSPSKRLMRFDAPSPNGSTDSRVIVLETRNNQPEPCGSGVSKSRTINPESRENRNSKTNNNNNNNNIENPIRANVNENRTNIVGNHLIKNNSDSATLNSNIVEINRSRDNNHSIGNNSSRVHNHSLDNNHSENNLSLDNNRSRDNNPSGDSNHNRDNSRNRDNKRRQINHSRDNNPSGDVNRSRDNSRSRDKTHSRDTNSVENRDSDSSESDVTSEGRTRRPRKAVTYKEKPLNRKLRR